MTSVFTLGIDVGGTNTDAALFDAVSQSVISSAKTRTLHCDYKKSIDKVLSILLENNKNICENILSCNVSTTLSTNAILEHKGSPVNMVLIGFEKYPHITEDIKKIISPKSILYIKGGHTSWGRERESLDLRTLEAFALAHRGELFAVSAMYSPRNPEHEIAAKNMLEKIGVHSVTCGYELAHAKLNSVKRSVTAYLNASLIPLTERLIEDTASAVRNHGVTSSIMFIRSDGSLVSSEWCRQFPIETIFSGPAASIKGAARLADRHSTASMTVIDMGGTSTDFGTIINGKAVFSDKGASIASYNTMIPSLEIQSIALGGDSIVQIDSLGLISVGPERVLPICRLCEDNLYSRGLVEERIRKIEENYCELMFVVPSLSAEPKSETDKDIYEKALKYPHTKNELIEYITFAHPEISSAESHVKELLMSNLLTISSCTPTDSLNVIGVTKVGCPELSKTALSAWAARLDTSPHDLAEIINLKTCESLNAEFVKINKKHKTEMSVYVGNPSRHFAPRESIAGEILIPRDGGVAGAIGAAVSSLELECTILAAHSFSNETYTAFLPDSAVSDESLEKCLKMAEAKIIPYLQSQAKKMGADKITVSIRKEFTYIGKNNEKDHILSVLLICSAKSY